MQYEDLTRKIIGCAYKVYNQLGFGYLESVYERCLVIELAKERLAFERQCPISVRYDGHVVGDFVADIVVEGEIIIELKSVRCLVEAHETQLVNYLVSTGKPVGLLLNFSETKVEIRRKIRELNATFTSD